MKKLMVIGVMFTAVLFLAGCGGGSAAPAAAEEEGGGAGGAAGGEASVATLSAVPSVDLSSYDYSASSAASSSLSAKGLSAKSVSLKAGDGLGKNMGCIGCVSRAGCEANMHKKEAIRMSQEAQLDRCHFEGMEAGGLITIPVDSYNYYKITMPEPSPEELEQMCGNIPEEDKKQACMEGEGPMGGNMLARIGRFGTNGNELRIDMCQGDEGSESRVGEATYTASGSVYTGTIVRIGNWGGEEEKMEFTMTVDAASVTNGVADLGSSGSATAAGKFNGGFGQGNITFTADAATASNIVSGAFAASFNDPYTGVANSFNGKTYAQFGGVSNTGTAKFFFDGTMPAMSLDEMVGGGPDVNDQQGIPDDQKDGFFQFMSEELEVEINEGNMASIKVCPNDDFDPSVEGSKGMVIADGDTCSHTKTDVESFSIANITNTGDTYTSLEQSFIIILNSSSAFYNAVNLINLDDYSADSGAIAFTRDWDCSPPDGVWTLEIVPEEMMVGTLPSGIDPDDIDKDAIETAMQKCMALEEKLHENQGMGGYDCADKEMAGDAGKDFGGGGPVGFEEGDDKGGMIPLPCVEQNLGPDACMDYCDAHPDECFGEGGEGPPPGDQMPQACIDAGIAEGDFQACGQYCQANPCF